MDIGFERDIDPTILVPAAGSNTTLAANLGWISEPVIVIADAAENELSAWPLKAKRVKSLPALVRKIDGEGNKWIVLYEYRTAKTKYEDKVPREHGLRQQEWYFLMCVVVSKSDRERLARALKTKEQIDVMQWDPREFTDGPFLREAPWRDTWPQQQWWTDVWGAPDRMQIAFPVFHYHWESHLDASMPEGARGNVPAPWLADGIPLFPDAPEATVWRDRQGNVKFIDADLGEGTTVVLKEESLHGLLRDRNLACVWLFVGERGVWPGGNNQRATWRRSEAVCWLDGSKPSFSYWSRDNGNRKAQRVVSKLSSKGGRKPKGRAS